ncbi:MAG: trehalose-phosphatase [Actinobacteria bacterium]|nr:trehalose-phosphatase [Actinomycetota bacterium]
METGSPIMSGAEALEGFVRAAASAPRAAALLCDIDGTISPIAPTPAEAHVPASFREVLEALVWRIGLVAFVTGRALEDGRRMIPVEGAAYIGTHGLETMAADGSVTVEPQAERYVPAIREITETAARTLDCEALGVVLEDKRAVLAVHYRLAEDPAATRHQILTRVVEPARARGLTIATGHHLFEVRPPLPFTKGSAVRRLLQAGDYLAVMSCGDDLTDVTMFGAVRDWSERDARRRSLAVAAVTDETPRPVTDAADVLVRATPGVQAALSRLAAALGAV